MTETWVDFRSKGDPEEEVERLASDGGGPRRAALSADPRTRFESFVSDSGAAPGRHCVTSTCSCRTRRSGSCRPASAIDRPPVDGLVDEHLGRRSPAAPRVAQQRHLLQLGLTDRLLGGCRLGCASSGAYDESAIVVVADHGASSGPARPGANATAATLADIAFVPFFFKAPHQRAGRVVDRHMRTVDVLPTLADALAHRVPWRHDGRSALSAGAPPRTSRARSGERHQRAAPQAAASARRERSKSRRACSVPAGSTRRSTHSAGHAGLVGTDRARCLVRPAICASNWIVPRGAPAWVTGRVTGPAARPGLRLAVAAAGASPARSATYRDGDRVVFALMLAPGSSATDNADVRVYRIQERPLRLQELRAT